MEDTELDPIRQVRLTKFWAFAGILWACFILLLVYTVTLSLSWTDMAVVLLPAAGVAGVAIELAARWEIRTHRRYAYPHRLGYVLASIHDFQKACDTSTRLIGEWLNLDVVIVAWMSEDDHTVVPVSAHGMPPKWCESAPGLPAASFGLSGKVNVTPAGLVQRLGADEEWFRTSHPRHVVQCIPLVSHDRAEGVLAVAARRRNPQVGDRRLLAALGLVLGLALDNCRLYEGQRAHAEHFQELSRMKSDFLSTVSHELRTPLTSIMMGADMLLEEEEFQDPGSTRGKLVRNIVKGAFRLKSLIEDLVNVSRDDEFQPRLEMEPTLLADPVTNAVSIVQPLVTAKHQTLGVELEDPECQVRIDRLRFEQVLINLLSNAQRYSPPYGHIQMTARTLPSGDCEIVVHDSGPGVQVEDREKIFEPFYRGELVELHSGRIWVEAAEGGGSRFCVVIPGEESATRHTPAVRIPGTESASRR
jgi:signal transduction histidine kinase